MFPFPGTKRSGVSLTIHSQLEPSLKSTFIDCVWNVMAHAQKECFVLRRNRRVHLNGRGASVLSTTGSRGVRIGGSNSGYNMFRGSVKGTDYPLHSPVSPSLSLPCVTVCQRISTELYVRVPFWPASHVIRSNVPIYCCKQHITLSTACLYPFIRIL
jgi:hypothetical protein